jgi:hypothetical protein
MATRMTLQCLMIQIHQLLPQLYFGYTMKDGKVSFIHMYTVANDMGGIIFPFLYGLAYLFLDYIFVFSISPLIYISCRCSFHS